MRVLGLDLGTRRIGVAASDSAGRLATPHELIARQGRPADDYARIAAMVREVGAELVVVGLPVSLDGSLGPAAKQALVEVEALSDVLEVPVRTHDERLTTVQAQSAMRRAGATSAARRRSVDKMAAAVMLQSWLDAATS